MTFKLFCFTVLLSQVFADKVFHLQSSYGCYMLSHQSALEMCGRVGAHLALRSEIKEAFNNGLKKCNCGWLLDKSLGFPMEYSKVKLKNNCKGHKTWDAYCYQGNPFKNCTRPLGMENGEIKNDQITASSYYITWYYTTWEAKKARLNFKGIFNAWIPKTDTKNEYLQIDLGRTMAVSGIVMQGINRYGRLQCVTQYMLLYGYDAKSWLKLKDKSGKTILLQGPNHNSIPVRQMFKEPFLAVHVRIHPYKWIRHPAMRIELLGCDHDVYEKAVEANSCGDED